MSTRGSRGRGTSGHGRCDRAGSSSSSNRPNLDTNERSASPVTETWSYDRAAGDDTLSQAMLRILERVVGPNTGAGGHGSVTERLRSNGAKFFRGIAGVSPNVEATERIMDDLDCTTEQKVKGVVSLLCDEAYQWWLTVKEGTQPDQLT
ncbi:ATP-dependent zinc metalloprotease FtsH [Gossypium australe]|uniref:ATP-dependent zinc metalloprotease FtsH n=1 Tax=Gossypium australe TaxID=47621 RepID=A0A5B6WGF0_9ROSI|nr:ATP-dependent zinc metalloprotease FtsH [Gossypium australe]